MSSDHLSSHQVTLNTVLSSNGEQPDYIMAVRETTSVYRRERERGREKHYIYRRDKDYIYGIYKSNVEMHVKGIVSFRIRASKCCIFLE